MLQKLNIPVEILPEVKESASVFGLYKDIPIAAIMEISSLLSFGTNLLYARFS